MAQIPVGVTINVNGNANNIIVSLTKNVSTLTNKLDVFSKRVTDIANIGFVVTHVTKAVQALNSRVKGLTDSYLAEATAITKLTAIMRNRLNATNDEIDSFVRLAAEQQRLGVIGDEVQIAAAQELMQYAKKSDSVKKLLPVFVLLEYSLVHGSVM
jgi:hypothetical protein